MIDLKDEVMDILNDFDEEVSSVLAEEVEAVSGEILRTLRNHPNIPKKTGKYRKGFRIKKTKSFRQSGAVVYNEEYQRTHLLENGHALPQGGRAKAFPHWRDAQKLAEELPDRIAERIGN